MRTGTRFLRKTILTICVSPNALLFSGREKRREFTTINEIAFEVGFNSKTSFNNNFHIILYRV